MKITKLAAVWMSAACTMGAGADVLFTQPPTTSGTLITSAYYSPDGSDSDRFMWDAFMLPAAGNIQEIRWRGGYPGGGTGGGNIADFEIAIYASIPAGTQPDLGFLYPGPLAHYIVSDYATGNAGETYAGNTGGTNMYDYHFTLPRAFLAAGNTRYWVQIIAWQNGWPTWGLANGAGGNGSHFARVPAAVGDYRYVFGTGDAAYSLIGTPAACSVPTITVNPTPVSVCFAGQDITLTAAATGSGPLSYRWRLNGNAVFDGPNGGGHGGGATISGATTGTLHISMPSYWADVGTYDCVISNACGPSVTAGALVGVSYGTPALSQQPVPASVCADGAADFTAAAGGTNGPFTYRWERETAAGSGLFTALSDGSTGSWDGGGPGVGGIVSGAFTASLRIAADSANGLHLGPAHAARYRCRVSNACGGTASNAALLTVDSCGACPADFNADGGVDGGDVESFFLAWEAGDSTADVNADGGVDGGDVETFFVAWEAGGC